MASLSLSQVCFSNASLPGMSVRQALALGQHLGFRAAELLAFHGYRHRAGSLAGFYWDRMCAAEREELRTIVAPFCRLALHAPFIDLHPLSPNPAIRQTSVEQLRVSIQAACALGAEVVTTHAMPVPQYSYDELKPQLVDLYRRLAEFAEPGNVRIGIETGWPRPEQLVDLVEAVDHPRVGITVDVGHLIYTLTPTQRDDPRAPLIYNELLIAHVRTAAPWLIHVHVHDVCYHDWRDHVALGDGIIDWPCLISVLEDAHYKGLLSLELEEACSKQALGRGFDFLVALVTKSSH